MIPSPVIMKIIDLSIEEGKLFPHLAELLFNEAIESFTLSDNALLPILAKYCPKLEAINFRSCISDVTHSQLLEFLQKCRNIKIAKGLFYLPNKLFHFVWGMLDLDILDFEEANYIGHLVKEFPINVKKLNLNYTGISSKDFRAILERCGPSLIELHIKTDQPDPYYAAISQYCPNLEKLYLTGINLTEDIILSLTSNCKLLKILQTEIPQSPDIQTLLEKSNIKTSKVKLPNKHW